jgi:hypothetical protein
MSQAKSYAARWDVSRKSRRDLIFFCASVENDPPLSLSNDSAGYYAAAMRTKFWRRRSIARRSVSFRRQQPLFFDARRLTIDTRALENDR